jgi:hypothetical protein
VVMVHYNANLWSSASTSEPPPWHFSGRLRRRRDA